jgi:hypothetical protein
MRNCSISFPQWGASLCRRTAAKREEHAGKRARFGIATSHGQKNNFREWKSSSPDVSSYTQPISPVFPSAPALPRHPSGPMLPLRVPTGDMPNLSRTTRTRKASCARAYFSLVGALRGYCLFLARDAALFSFLTRDAVRCLKAIWIPLAQLGDVGLNHLLERPAKDTPDQHQIPQHVS